MNNIPYQEPKAKPVKRLNPDQGTYKDEQHQITQLQSWQIKANKQQMRR